MEQPKQKDIKEVSGEELALELQDRYMSIQRIQNEIQAINAEISRRLNTQKEIDTIEKEIEDVG